MDAVRLLGGQDRTALSTLDSIMNMLLGVVPGTAFGLLDQKSEVTALGRDLLRNFRRRQQPSSLTRAERNRRFGAAHAVLVVTAYFDALAEADLPVPFASLELTEAERLLLASGSKDADDTPVGWLLSVPVPPPSADGPSTDHLQQLSEHYAGMSTRMRSFVSGLASWERMADRDRRRFLAALDEVPDDACARYIEMQLQLANDVPEWRTWARTQEHVSALAAARGTTSVPEEPHVPGRAGGRDQPAATNWRAALYAAYNAIIDEPVAGPYDVPADAVVPTLADSYITPSVSSGGAHDWEALINTDLASPRSLLAPLVVTGPAGSGKTALMRMLAARLPENQFVAVYTRGDRLSDALGVHEHVELAIAEVTGVSLPWATIVEHLGDSRPVLLIDGLVSFSMLRVVADFQRRQAEENMPVSVIVTADPANISTPSVSSDTLVVSLEPFDEERLARWLDVWNRLNSDYLIRRGLRPLSTPQVLEHLPRTGRPGVLVAVATYDAAGNGWQNAGRPERDQMVERWARAVSRSPRVEHAGYAPDVAEGEDLLGITGEVSTLCRVLLAEDASPPISVGLFGTWGTGKSFFMDKMRAQVSALAAQARQARLEGGGTGFCGEVRQVTFNAWHYMDASLWATLADTIFDGIVQNVDGSPTGADGRADILAELESVHLVRAELARERDEAQRYLDEASQSLTQQPIGLGDVVKAEPVRRYATRFTSDLERELTAKLTKAGFDEQQINDLRVLDDLTTIQQVATLFRRGTWTTRIWFAVALLASAVGMGGLVYSWITRSTELLAAVIAPATLAVLTGGVVIHRYLSRIGSVVRTAGEIVRAVDEQRAAPIRAQQDSLRQMIVRYEEQIVAADARIKLLDSGRSALAFAHIRHVAGDYKRHEGVVSLVRRDLEQLSQMLTERRSDARLDAPEVERIILYIDDLDRCPAERVVEVLQAIHLLLAFPLFVVVVGVDVRWLLRALHRHHRELAGGDNAGDLDDWAAAPHDYLEKIFQLPYCLRPMSGLGYERLIHQLVTVEPDESSRPDPATFAEDGNRQIDPDPARHADEPRARTHRANRTATATGAQPHLARRLAVYHGGAKPLAVTMNRDGTRVVWVDVDGTVHQRDLRRNRTSPPPLRIGPPTSVMTTADGHLFIGQKDGRTLLIDGTTLERRATLVPPAPDDAKVPTVVAATPDAGTVVLAWPQAEPPMRYSLARVELSVPDATVSMMPPGDYAQRAWLMTRSWRLVDDAGHPTLVTEATPAQRYRLGNQPIKAAVSAGDHYLVTLGADQRLSAWRIGTEPGRQPQAVRLPDEWQADTLALDATGRLAAVRGADVRLWNLTNGTSISEFTTSSPVCSLALAPDGRRLIVAHDDGAMDIWLVAAARPEHESTASALRMTSNERDALAAVGGLIATPRSAKRLVNSYRLLRAGLRRPDLDRLTGSATEHATVIVLLALLVGYPDRAARLLQRLLGGSQQMPPTFTELVTTSEAELTGSDSDTAPAMFLARITTAIRAVGAPQDIDPYRQWASRVARFSFRTGIMLQEPWHG